MATAAVPVEIIFAQKLASNEPKVRDRAVKKLSAFLRAHVVAGNQAEFTEDEMLRIWKGLHYCFWMSDKMLVQEELAEKISGLVQIFEKHPRAATFFVRSGLITLGREWLGIDRLRMDKFMMFVRRFLRQIFVLAAKWNWEDLDELVRVFEQDVICANKGIKEAKTSLGFQLHFTDVFLEELAKVGGEDLADSAIRRFLAPFVKELREGREERLRSHIVERVFHHLMRQSDVGIAYEEDDDVQEEDGELEHSGQEEEEEELKDSSEDEEVEVDMPKDPRAGKVDVTIPQLMVDYQKLAEDFFAAGNDGKIGKFHRRTLFKLTKQFRALADGKFPLAIELSDDEEEVEGIKLKKVVRVNEIEDDAEMEKRKNERKEYKMALKQKLKRKLSEMEEDESSSTPVTSAVKRRKGNNSASKRVSTKKSPKMSPKKLQTKPGLQSPTISSSLKAAEQLSSLANGKLPLAAELPLGKQEVEGIKQKKVMKVGEEDDEAELQKKKKERKELKMALKQKKLKKKKNISEVEENDSTSTPVTSTVKRKKENNLVSTKKSSKKLLTNSDLASPNPSSLSNGKVPVDTEKVEEIRPSKVTEPVVQKWKSEQKEHKLALKQKKLKKLSEMEKDSSSSTPVTTSAKKIKDKKAKKRHSEAEEVLPMNGLSGYAPPTIKTTPNMPTPAFIRKAVSKSGILTSPSKKSSKKLLSNSEPRSTTNPLSKRKRINFALTCNKYQSVDSHEISVNNSPGIPFNADKKPKQGVLKNKNDISIVNTPSPSLDPKAVQKNTKINSKSKTMKVLSRMRAKDFL